MTRMLSLPQRRLATAFQLLSYPALFIAAREVGLSTDWAMLAGMLAFAGLSAYLYWGTSLWQASNAPDARLDERQIQVRDRAYRLAYAIVSTLLLTFLFYLMVAHDFHLPVLQDYNELSPFFWEFWTLVIVLPATVLAWTEPTV